MSRRILSNYNPNSQVRRSQPNSQVSRSPGPQLTASSLRRITMKKNHCKFCIGNFFKRRLLRHLKNHNPCLILYQRMLRVKSLENLVVKLFSCQFCCETKKLDLKIHLSSSEDCLKSYQTKYDIVSIHAIVRKIYNLKRNLQGSRTAVARKLEYENKKEKAKILKSMVSSINDYKLSVLYSNFKLCVICLGNFCETSARVIQVDEDIYEEEKLENDDKQFLRRHEKFNICYKCEKKKQSNNKAIDEIEGKKKEVSLSEFTTADRRIFYPSNESEERENHDLLNQNICLMWPRVSSAIKIIGKDKKVTEQNIEIEKLYRNDPLSIYDLDRLYENEIHKYKYFENSTSLYVAQIQDVNTKTLSAIEKVKSEFGITGSDDWVNVQQTQFQERQSQQGHIYITVKIELPLNSIDLIATALIQDGYVITNNTYGLGTGEFIVKYLMHLNHRSDTDCDHSCQTLDLKEWIEENIFETDKLCHQQIGIQVAAIHQRIFSFVKNLVQAPASYLFSNNYYFQLIFDVDGTSAMIGAIWPEKLDEINKNLASRGGCIDEKEDLIQFIEGILSSSSDERIIRSTFNISLEEARRISDLVKSYQIHICNNMCEESCGHRYNIELPSLITILKTPCSEINSRFSEKMKTKMKLQMEALSLEEKKTMSTYDWLESVWENVTAEIDDETREFKITLDDGDELSFKIDETVEMFLEEFLESPLTALYHYALSCENHKDDSFLVMKRLKLIDSYTKSYNPGFLRAQESTIYVNLVRSNRLFKKLVSSSKKPLTNEEKDLFSNRDIFFSHRLISLLEAMSLADKTKRRIVSSSKCEFVNAKLKRRLLVKKVKVSSPTSFKLSHGEGHYELLSTNISRHFQRKNGDCLLLAESILWYDFCGKEKSEEISALYENSQVPPSEIQSAFDDRIMLPKFILCSNGDALKIREKKKIMITPKSFNDYEMMYSKCLLYLCLKSESEIRDISRYDLGCKYREKHTDFPNCSIIEVHERKLFPFLLQKLKIEDEDLVENETVDSHSDDDVLEDGENGDDSDEEAPMLQGSGALDILLTILDEEETVGGLEDNVNVVEDIFMNEH